eukprot:4674766-Pyramimonas_sp.AAC.1
MPQAFSRKGGTRTARWPFCFRSDLHLNAAGSPTKPWPAAASITAPPRPRAEPVDARPPAAERR